MDDKVYEMGDGSYNHAKDAPIGGRMPNVHTPDGMLADNTEFNRKQQQASMDRRAQEIILAVAKLQKELPDIKALTPIGAMDLLERVISECGGEKKLQFIEVSHDFVKAKTRVPMDANLLPFMPESDSNIRFHKTVTKLLILCPAVDAVKWMPTDDRGSYIMISIKR